MKAKYESPEMEFMLLGDTDVVVESPTVFVDEGNVDNPDPSM